MLRNPAERLALLNGCGPTTDDLVCVVRSERSVIGECSYGDRHIEFEATNIRSERTGVHARLEVFADGASLGFTVDNIERDEARTRIANSAAKRLGDTKQHAEPLKLRLDQFCAALWPEWTRGDEGSWESGVDRQTKWLLKPYLLEDAGTILYGPPGAAKSTVTMAWALSITHGVGPWELGASGPVLFVNMERSSFSVRFRVREMAKALGTPEELLVMHARGRTLADLAMAAAQTVEREGCVAVMVDSLSRSGTGDLNMNDPANRAMDVLNGLGCAWCIIAHTPRSDTSHVYGSVMFEAAADLCVGMISAEAGGAHGASATGVRLEVTKANDVRKARPELWAFDFGPDDEGLVAIRRPAPGEFVDLEVSTQTIEERIADVLKGGSMTAAQIADEIDVDRATVGATCRKSRRITRLASPGGGRGNSTMWGLKQSEDAA